MLEGKQVIFTYQGHVRETCPHAIGYKNGLEKVLTYQFGGGSNSGLPITGQWRCIFVSEAQDVQIRDGEWHTNNRHSQPQTCIDNVDVEIRIDAHHTPTPYTHRA